MTRLLEVSDLRVAIEQNANTLYPVDGASFTLDEGEVLAVVGESGSGKTMTSLAVMGLLPQQVTVSSGSIRWKGTELVGADEEVRRRLRGSEIAMIFQDPMTSLNPVMTIGRQLTEAVLVHNRIKQTEAWDRAHAALVEVGIPEPEKRLRAYPHELSGGMRQRVMIAMALINRPALLIADEPTTALDVTIQAQVLELIGEIQERTHCAVMLITHDLGVVAGIADTVLVMYAGRMAEESDRDAVFYHSAHPYTKGLLSAVPKLDADLDRLTPIIGNPPSLSRVPSGCAFHPRCPYAERKCETDQPQWRQLTGDHGVACHFAEQVMNDAPVVSS